MFGCWVAFVSAKSVFGKPGVEFVHRPVALDFCDDACSGDAQAEAVPADQCRVGARKIRDRQSVNQRVRRADGEREERAAHREVGSTQDVHFVNLAGLAAGARPEYVGIRCQPRMERFPLARAELLGVVKARKQKSRRQNDCGGNDRTGERAAPGLVNPGHRKNPARHQFEFRAERAGH